MTEPRTFQPDEHDEMMEYLSTLSPHGVTVTNPDGTVTVANGAEWDESTAHDAAAWLAAAGIPAEVVNTGGNTLCVEAVRPSDGFVVWAGDATGDWTVIVHDPAVEHYDDDAEYPTTNIAAFVATFAREMNR